MIHYHGGPVTPNTAAMALWTRRHAMVSFARPDQIELAAEVCQSFAVDNGAYSFWKGGEAPDWNAYADFLDHWSRHPGFDFAIIPDVIEGDEKENDRLIDEWFGQFTYSQGAPVWHMHERLARLEALTRFPRIALGSTSQFAQVGSVDWWARMAEAMKVICDEQGRPRCKLHGLRMLNPTIFSYLPLSSADSTNVARNIGLDNKWDSPYCPRSKDVRAMVLVDRIEGHASASRWSGMVIGPQMNLELLG
ncbi:MAG: hypothetical protein V4563_18405 [Pseudomonadota bacterium]